MKIIDTALILAGGQSKRMGFDKQFLRIEDHWIVDLQIKSLKALFKEIIIITNKPEEYKDFPYEIIMDEIENFGPLGGIHAGLKYSNSEYNYVIACDMPFIAIEYIKYMKEEIALQSSAVDAVVTRFGKWIEPMNAFYGKSLIARIEKNALEDKRKVSTLLEEAKVLYIEEDKAREYSPQWEMFDNLNKPEDYDKYFHKKRGET